MFSDKPIQRGNKRKFKEKSRTCSPSWQSVIDTCVFQILKYYQKWGIEKYKWDN